MYTTSVASALCVRRRDDDRSIVPGPDQLPAAGECCVVVGDWTGEVERQRRQHQQVRVGA